MNTSSFRLIWRYQAVWLLRSYGTWIIGGVFVILALTQGLFTQYTPRIIRFLAGSEVTTLIQSLPEPSWQQAYAGWIKNLTQILTVILVAMNSFRCSVLTGNGDIPFFSPVACSAHTTSSALLSAAGYLPYSLPSSALPWLGQEHHCYSQALIPPRSYWLVWYGRYKSFSFTQHKRSQPLLNQASACPLRPDSEPTY